MKIRPKQAAEIGRIISEHGEAGQSVDISQGLGRTIDLESTTVDGNTVSYAVGGKGKVTRIEVIEK